MHVNKTMLCFYNLSALLKSLVKLLYEGYLKWIIPNIIVLIIKYIATKISRLKNISGFKIYLFTSYK